MDFYKIRRSGCWWCRMTPPWRWAACASAKGRQRRRTQRPEEHHPASGHRSVPRVRVGGRKPHPDYDMADWVLGKFQGRIKSHRRGGKAGRRRGGVLPEGGPGPGDEPLQRMRGCAPEEGSLMAEQHTLRVIARIHSDFPTKFRHPAAEWPGGGRCALRWCLSRSTAIRTPCGAGGLFHLWLIWQFSPGGAGELVPTVRPPRLGGNTRMGVFATRSPFRPNPIGLSRVRLERIEQHPQWGPVLWVAGG